MLIKQRHPQEAESRSHVPGAVPMTEKEQERITDVGASPPGFRSARPCSTAAALRQVTRPLRGKRNEAKSL